MLVTTSPGISTVLGISLPVASDLTATTDLTGLGQPYQPGRDQSMYFQPNTATDVADVKFTESAAGALTIVFNFTYSVL